MASLQITVFDVCGTACALHRSAAREFLPLPRLWRPPALPRPVAGFFNLGGHAVPVLRLDVLFGLQQSEDGAQGLVELRRAGGYGLAEDESSAVVYGMPAAAVRMGGVNVSLPLDLIAPRILRLARREGE
jgi:chemotaxis signal transduction protein